MEVKAILENKEPIVVNIDARDRRAFEIVGRKEFGIPSNANLQDAVKGIPESYIGWLSWHAISRTNGYKENWQTFESQLLRVESLEEEEEVFDFPTE